MEGVVRTVRLTVADDGQTRDFEVEPAAPGSGEWIAGRLRGVILDDGERVPVRAVRDGDRLWVWCRGSTFEFRIAGPSGRGAAGGDSGLLSPMPGKVLRVAVAEGDRVERGATILILEAMKMEHEIQAPVAGVVRKILYGEGESVDAGAPLVEFEG